jgi:hypothetical protein
MNEKTTSEVFPQARIAPNGDLLFPKRGEAPRAIQGYKQDKGDPFIYHPILKPCIFRSSCWKKVCGGMVQKLDCKHFKIIVSFNDCEVCKERKE